MLLRLFFSLGFQGWGLNPRPLEERGAWMPVELKKARWKSCSWVNVSFNCKTCNCILKHPGDFAAQRQIGETSLNEASSRSHQILRLVKLDIHFNVKFQVITTWQSFIKRFTVYVHMPDNWKFRTWVCRPLQVQHSCFHCGMRCEKFLGLWYIW